MELGESWLEGDRDLVGDGDLAGFVTGHVFDADAACHVGQEDVFTATHLVSLYGDRLIREFTFWRRERDVDDQVLHAPNDTHLFSDGFVSQEVFVELWRDPGGPFGVSSPIQTIEGAMSRVNGIVRRSMLNSGLGFDEQEEDEETDDDKTENEV